MRSHQPAFLAFSPDGLGIHGLIYQVAQGESGKRLTRYTLSIVQQLSYLALRTNRQTFQHLTVPQIVALVPQEFGIQNKLPSCKWPERAAVRSAAVSASLGLLPAEDR